MEFAAGARQCALVIANIFSIALAVDLFCMNFTTTAQAVPVESKAIDGKTFTSTYQSGLVVPVVRSRSFAKHLSQQAAAEKNSETLVVEPFVGDLVVMYVEDHPNSMQYLGHSSVSHLKYPPSRLREATLANLNRVLSSIEDQHSQVFGALAAGGNYESSLLLSDKIWNKLEIQNKGALVVAVPARDVVLYASRQDKQAIERMRSLSNKIFHKSEYAITPNLFLRLSGKWTPFQ